MHSRGDVARGSNRPTEAVPWINEIVKAKNLGDPSERYSISGATHGDFKTLGSKKISGLMIILQWDFRKRLIEEEKSSATIQVHDRERTSHGWCELHRASLLCCVCSLLVFLDVLSMLC